MTLKTEDFVNNIVEEFSYRRRTNQPDSAVKISASVHHRIIRFGFEFESHKLELVIPEPYTDSNGNSVIGESVIRCTGLWQVGKTVYGYLDFIQFLLCNRIDNIVDGPRTMSTQIAKLIKLDTYPNPAVIVRGTQKILSAVINSLPLSESPLKDYFMNRRIQIIDPNFKNLSPEFKLKYQIAKQIAYFPWTSIGLADGSAATNNHILTETIQPFTPFQRYDNPMRNLYSTLGMKWDDFPLIQTKKEAECPAKRTGRNLVTLFLNDPDNFEDQIILSNRLKGLPFKETRRIVTYGNPTVFVGERIEPGKILALEPNSSRTTFDVICDDAKVVAILDTPIEFNSKSMTVKTIVIEVERKLKHGFKITNRHGNKGVITFNDTGHAIDPTTGERVHIDVIVSAKSVGKRKNSGQILEALFNNLLDGKNWIIEDDVQVDLEGLRSKLMERGYPKDLTCEVNTFRGNARGIVGRVFWGIIKTVEDQIWTDEDLSEIKSNGMHRAGLKLGPIEFKALCTVFGEDREPIFTEIFSHCSGKLETLEHLYVIRSGFGSFDGGLPKVHVKHIRGVEQIEGYFQSREGFEGTVADIERFPKPFLMELPFELVSEVTPDGGVNYLLDEKNVSNKKNKIFKTKYIYIPGQDVRRPWMHPTGLLGMNETTTLINNVVDFCNRPQDVTNWSINALTSVATLLKVLAKRMSSKKGWLNQNILSVRYPKSAKAVATQNSKLPPNHIGIHKFMATQLGIKENDCVIVERFPCLGFPSMRLQRVKIHEDSDRAYVIEVSGNSLVSLGLDFDGDVIYLCAFDNPQAQEVLEKHFENPNPRMAEILNAMNDRIKPESAELGFDDYGINMFPPPSGKYNSEIIDSLAGVKLYTGPIIALCYNLLRIIEPHIEAKDPENIAVELLLDRVANSVFSMKHGSKSLQEDTVKAICLADENLLMKIFSKNKPNERERYGALEITRDDAKRICEIIRAEAQAIGVWDLKKHYDKYIASDKARSNIISLIVRKRRKVYFATRASLSTYQFLEHLYDRSCPEDLVASILKFRMGDVLGWNLQKGRVVSP